MTVSIPTPLRIGMSQKVEVSYIEITGIESVTTWARWKSQLVEIKATRVGFLTGDLGLIYLVSYAFVRKSKCLGFDPRSGIACIK